MHLVADVGVSWCVADVAAIWEDSRVDGGDEVISMVYDLFLHSAIGVIK